MERLKNDAYSRVERARDRHDSGMYSRDIVNDAYDSFYVESSEIIEECKSRYFKDVFKFEMNVWGCVTDHSKHP